MSDIVEFVRKTTWDALPLEVQERARLCLLDNAAAAVVGTLTPAARIAATFAHNRQQGEESTVLATGEKAWASAAAFANGVAANGTDIDDCGLYTWGHPGAQVFSAALAAAEMSGASGRSFMSACVVGYEIMFRAGRCWYDNDPLLRGCGSWGSIGCSAIASHLWGLSADETANALGIAEYHAPCLPLMRDVREPRMVKHGIGVGAFNGLLSAELAGAGYTGITSILALPEYEKWVADIGTHYILPYGIMWKEFSCCAWTHSPLYAVQKLQREHPDLRFEHIGRINIETYEEAAALGTVLPNTTEEAQFNLAWPVAAQLVDAEVGPRQVLAERLCSEEIRRLVCCTTVEVSEELTRRYELAELGDPEGMDAARVRLTLSDGTELASGLVQQPLYTKAGRGWSREQMERKFKWLMGHVSSNAACQADHVIDLLWHTDEQPSVDIIADSLKGLLV